MSTKKKAPATETHAARRAPKRRSAAARAPARAEIGVTIAELAPLAPAARDARLVDHLRTHGALGVRSALAALAKYPSATVAAAALARLEHPDFTSQLPNGRAEQRALRSELRALGKKHPAIAAGLRETVSASGAAKAALPAKGDDVLTRIEKLRAAWSPSLEQGARAKWENAVHAVHVELFGKWSPYPAWAWGDLDAAQRALKELIYDAPSPPRTPEQDESLGRRIGRLPPGPADVELALERPRPLWCAVNDVAAQLRAPGPVLDAFRALPPASALAAWNELARGIHEVDVDHAKEWKFAGDAGVRPFNVAFRQRFVELLADMSLGLGAAGEKAAERLAPETAKTHAAIRRAVLSAFALARHAETRGEKLAARWDGLLGRIFAWPSNPGIETRLREMLGESRIAGLPIAP